MDERVHLCVSGYCKHVVDQCSKGRHSLAFRKQRRASRACSITQNQRTTLRSSTQLSPLKVARQQTDLEHAKLHDHCTQADQDPLGPSSACIMTVAAAQNASLNDDTWNARCGDE
eukprot:6208040-Pleurochrysis_carterae.AAC.2